MRDEDGDRGAATAAKPLEARLFDARNGGARCPMADASAGVTCASLHGTEGSWPATS